MIDYYCKIHKQYPHLSENVIEELVEQAKEVLINTLYSSYYTITTEMRQYAYTRYEYWIYKVVKSMIPKLGLEGITTYSENLLSITFSSDDVSQSLLKEITPLMRY